MKLSQLTTEEAASVLCEITPHILNITGDKALLDNLGKKFDTKGKSVAELYTFAAKKYASVIPIVLKDHREDVFGILSILNECTPEEVGKQNIIKTMYQVREAFKDKEFLDFFKSWQQEESE